MADKGKQKWVTLDVKNPIWGRFFTAAPLVVVGTKEFDHYDLAPKHMVTALGHDNYFGFVCTPNHSTYRNAKREKEFTVSFIRANQIVLASLSAAPRCGDESNVKSIISEIPTRKATVVNALFVKDSYLLLECQLDRIVDGFGEFSLIAGKIIAAHVHPKALRTSEMDDGEMIEQMPLLSYLAYGRFAEIKDSLAFPFPKDFNQKVLENN